jgi:hypothetical protein
MMDLARLERTLIETARRMVPRDAVPFAFERRVMAALIPPLGADPWNVFLLVLRRAAVVSLAITALAGTWSVVSPRIDREQVPLAEQLETVVLGDLEPPGEGW